MDVSECEGGTLSRLCKGATTKCCLPQIKPIPEPTNPVMKKDSFFKVFRNNIRNRAMYRYLDKLMREANITTCHCQAAFLAQVSPAAKLGGLAIARGPSGCVLSIFKLACTDPLPGGSMFP